MCGLCPFGMAICAQYGCMSSCCLHAQEKTLQTTGNGWSLGWKYWKGRGSEWVIDISILYWREQTICTNDFTLTCLSPGWSCPKHQLYQRPKISWCKKCKTKCNYSQGNKRLHHHKRQNLKANSAGYTMKKKLSEISAIWELQKSFISTISEQTNAQNCYTQHFIIYHKLFWISWNMMKLLEHISFCLQIWTFNT